MPAYVTIQLQITDEAAFADYRAVAGDALSKHGGKIVAGPAEPLYDAEIGVLPTALIEFPSVDAARAWIADPDLVEVHALRNRGAKASLSLLPAKA